MTVRIMVGHVLDQLALLPDESVHCVVTSPPYYGLRDYGIEPQVWGGDPGCAHEWGRIGPPHHPGQVPDGKAVHNENARGQTIGSGQFCLLCNAWRGALGLEPTLDLYLDHMIEVFREVRRVIRKDATCWLNMGDSYANDGKWGGHTGGKHVKALHDSPIGRNKRYTGFKPKDLMLIPSRLAIRLQDDGWWVRSDIAWCKRAPMPESCTDRPTSAWEHVFLLSKSARYFYDAEAVKEEAETAGQSIKMADGWDTGPGAHGTIHRDGREKGKPNNAVQSSRRNLRNFWLLGPEPFPEAHFATFPTEIPRRAILAGTSERGVCPKCGAPWERAVKKSGAFGKGWHDHDNDLHLGQRGGMSAQKGADREAYKNYSVETLGWRPTCGCDAGDAVPATVFDPFLGSGTTGLVADRLGRDCIGIELNPEYAEMARKRIAGDAPLLAEVRNGQQIVVDKAPPATLGPAT